jgi:hypothetical protein
MVLKNKSLKKLKNYISFCKNLTEYVRNTKKTKRNNNKKRNTKKNNISRKNNNKANNLKLNQLQRELKELEDLQKVKMNKMKLKIKNAINNKRIKKQSVNN